MKDLVRFARDSLGLILYPGQAQILSDWGASDKKQAVLVLGRRSGKGVMSAAAAIFNACIMDYSSYLRPREARFIVVIANRLEQAMEFIRVVRELLEEALDPDLLAMVDEKKSTATQIAFTNGSVIRAMPTSGKPVRGVPVSLLVLDEAGQFSSVQGSFTAGAEIYKAAAGGTIQFKDQGFIMLTSTPGMWCEGILWDLFQAGVSGAATDIFTAQKAVWEVNPEITRESLEAFFVADPDGSRAEYGGQFVDGVGAYFDASAVAECIIKGRTALPPVDDVHYCASMDPAFAQGGDQFGYSIGHRIGSGDDTVFVIDRLESWRGRNSPLNSDRVMDEIAAISAEYRITEIVSDQFAYQVLADGFRRRGIALKAQPLHNALNAEIMGTFRRAINTGHAELLDHPASVNEMHHIQQRPTESGKPKIGAASGYHDDLVMVLATVVHMMRAKKERPDISSAFGSINQSLVRSGDRAEPFGFGTTGRSPLTWSGGGWDRRA